MFRGHFPCSLAPGFYGDRYVMVGDAAGLMRAFKGKGTTSGMLTGIRAAETMFEAGISAAAFRSHYVPANADIIDDLPYGRVTRVLVNASLRAHLLDSIVRAAKYDERVRESLYGAVSAHAPYRHVLGGMLHPHSIAAVLRRLAPVARR